MANRFDNVSDAALADMIGALDVRIKALGEEIEPLKEEFKRRGCSAVRGSQFVVTASTSTSKRIDTKRLREVLGDAVSEVEKETTSTRILVKPIVQIDAAA